MKIGRATPLPVVLVDDDEGMLMVYAMLLKGHGIGPVMAFDDGAQLLPFLRRNEAAAVVLDLSLPTVNGKELLERVVEEFPQLPVMVSTAAAEVGQAVSCMRAGACDYLVKPIDNLVFLAAIDRALGLARGPAHHWERETASPEITTEDREMLALLRRTKAVSRSGQPVLVTGETGVGKELFAEAVHRFGGSRGEFVTVNVAGLDDAVFSDTLFGHRKGAFTGAQQNRDGLIKRAAGGTLFLDEIGELPELSQIKLLRLIQEHEYLPLGCDTPTFSDAGVVVATNRDLKRLLELGRLREDLYYRLCCHQIHVPPLRERSGDIPLLLDHFVAQAARRMGKAKPSYPPELPRMLERYHFPGNVRELQAMVYDAVALHEKGSLPLSSFRKRIDASSGEARLTAEEESVTVTFHGFPSMKEAQTLLISEALRMSNGNQGEAASLLGISRQALNNRLRRKAGMP
ncbi:chemotaxis protein CheY [Geoanaerobacter pelophilus]|uniref:Chemotaxis protein CheY n=1 Tax=Geoanaerobacter pelophilus TaxID=60036 RepID=A0ABQ0MJF7_9BACT|nr:sigma-54 dependent transcriptional regulator [Geoanaerobacter pelophilus]GAW67202.1 chemotaxis protein CheY [Geoanaerobacter pelophilus]